MAALRQTVYAISDSHRYECVVAMRNSAVRFFSDPDEYDRSIRAGAVSGLRFARGAFQAELTRADFGRAWMQRFKESAARTLRVAVHPSRSGILFRIPGGTSTFRH